MTTEARIVRRTGWIVEIGGGTFAGAEAAASRALARGARALISFGLAGGLDPTLRAGDVVVPAAVSVRGRTIATDTGLCAPTAASLLGAETVVSDTSQKQAVFAATGCVAVDIESGAVAAVASAAGVPFAAVRAICDTADRTLPPAALVALDNAGAIGFVRLLTSIVAHPTQIPALIGLGRDAARARTALLDWLSKNVREP